MKPVGDSPDPGLELEAEEPDTKLPDILSTPKKEHRQAGISTVNLAAKIPKFTVQPSSATDEKPIHDIQTSSNAECAEPLTETTEGGKNAEDTAPNQEAPKKRIPYNSGYGDFCFGRLTRWEMQYSSQARFYQSAEGKLGFEGTRGLPYPELDGYERQGKFDYLKLPPEIRDMVYANLDAYFRRTDMGVGGIPFEVKLWHGPYVSRLEYAYRTADEAERTYMEKREYRRAQDPHPNRPAFDVQLWDIGWPANGWKNLHAYWLTIQTIRQLSNVCCQVRKELGSALWRMSDITFDEPAVAISFLGLRPPVAGALRFVSFAEFDCLVDDYGDIGIENVQSVRLSQILHLCQHITKLGWTQFGVSNTWKRPERLMSRQGKVSIPVPNQRNTCPQILLPEIYCIRISYSG